MARKRKRLKGRDRDINRRGLTEFTLTTVAYLPRPFHYLSPVDLSGIIR